MDNDLISRSQVYEALTKQEQLTPSVLRRVLLQVPTVDAVDAVDAVEIVRCKDCCNKSRISRDGSVSISRKADYDVHIRFFVVTANGKEVLSDGGLVLEL